MLKKNSRDKLDLLIKEALIDAVDSLCQLYRGEWEPDEREFRRVLKKYEKILNF